MPDLSTREILEIQSNGLTPIKRQEPKYGEKEYYYINPNRDKYSSLSEDDIAYVDSPDDPNPFLQQFNSTDNLDKNALFENSETNNVYQQTTKTFNNYFIPQEVYTDSNWGKKTAKKLNEYMKNYTSYPGKTTTGLLAPFTDMKRNYNDMKNIDLIGADNFFHCKANYEAAKRGPWGKIVGKTMSAGRELTGLLCGDSLADIRKDWHANSMGWNGAEKGLTLEQSCPTNPKEYVNLKDY